MKTLFCMLGLGLTACVPFLQLGTNGDQDELCHANR